MPEPVLEAGETEPTAVDPFEPTVELARKKLAALFAEGSGEVVAEEIEGQSSRRVP